MSIAGIEAIPLRIPFKAGTKSDASAWGDSNLPAADSLLVKVTTDQGLVGWGEAFGFSSSRFRQARRRPTDCAALYRPGRNADRAADAGGPEEAARLWAGRRPCLCHLGGRHRPLDIAGKAAMRRCASFWAAVRPSWTAMRAWSRYSEPSFVRAAVRQAIEAGFRTLKTS